MHCLELHHSQHRSYTAPARQSTRNAKLTVKTRRQISKFNHLLPRATESHKQQSSYRSGTVMNGKLEMSNGISYMSDSRSKTTSIADRNSRHDSRKKPRVVVFSGGTAFNSVAEKMMKWTTDVSYVLPVSDDGGSTAEIVRVVGGPAVGDIRSRCLRLADKSDAESRAVQALLSHRLSAHDDREAKGEWMEIVEGKHVLWEHVTEPYKHTIRAFLIFFQNEILRNCRTHFDYRNGSVGNFFFAGARLFFHSLEAAIFLFSRVTRIPEGSRVLPAIQTEERITLGAQLENGQFIRGQSEISHPHQSNAHIVNKCFDGHPLPAAIHRVFYLASEGTGVEHEVQFQANQSVVSALQQSDVVIYGMGSLYTSICSTLILKGIGEVISEKLCPKVLILNGNHDRETCLHLSPRQEGRMAATDVVQAVADALNRLGSVNDALSNSISSYMTTVVYPRNGQIQIDEAALREMGIQKLVEVDSVHDHNGNVRYKPEALVQALTEIAEIHFRDMADIHRQ